MPSDLATALVSGNNSAAMMTDPTMAAIAPQLQLAQALSTQGMSTAPASPWQAAGRLAQALAGVKIGNDVQEQIGGLNTGAAPEMERLFKGTPVGEALKSPSPLVRMMAMQQAGKLMLLNSETKKLGTTDVISSPTIPGQPGGVVASGVPGMAGAAETAKNPALIARAGGEAAAKAPFEGGGTAVIPGGPSGSQEIPITAQTRANMQSMVPKPVPVETFRKPDVVVGNSTTPDKGQDRVPTSASPVPGIAGKPVETPEYKATEKRFGAGEEAIGKVIAEHIEAGGRASRDKLNALDTMETALRNGGKNVFTGPHSDAVLKAKQTLDALGVQSDLIKQGLPESEIVGKMNAQLSSASAKAMTGRPTQAEFLIWQRNNPGLMTSKEGSLALMDVIRQQTKQDIELGKLAQNKKNWDNWPEVVDKFYETHGLTNPLTGKPMRDEIKAAHGEAGSGAASGAPAKSTTPPAGAPAGTKQSPNDGHWYAPDPARPGKFLRVD